jgi:Arc/MetJ-type ribon-helix-helix transcriptional regulator
MATRKILSLPPEMAQAVEDFRFSGRFKTESDALRRLIELGLAASAAAPVMNKPKPKRKP